MTDKMADLMAALGLVDPEANDASAMEQCIHAARRLYGERTMLVKALDYALRVWEGSLSAPKEELEQWCRDARKALGVKQGGL